MCLVRIEQGVAVQLEREIHTLYLASKHTTQVDQFEIKRNELAKSLLNSHKDWQILFSQHRYSDLSFWLEILRKVYHLEKLKLNLPDRIIHDAKSVQPLIEHVLNRLKQVFKSSGFLEQLTAHHEKQNKVFHRLKERYIKLTQMNVDPDHEYFYLTIHPDCVDQMDILSLMKAFSSLEKNLKQQRVVTSGVAAYFYHIEYDRKQQRYGIHLYFILNRHLRLERSNYLEVICGLWQDRTLGMGMVQPDQAEFAYPCFESFDPTDVEGYQLCKDPLDYLEYLSVNYYLTDAFSNRLSVLPGKQADFGLQLLS
ncbi:hypothetical protein C9426_14260 [Serratia sp. S1B]|nr:hypothetical protein C9426_14260 [Serratia sp. S1B]